ncbi:hypothetical protein DFP72DRAFT_1178615 [Ephemerocybe angulata]|uniref:Uncharacterized protein n=1 Tax=Ephemerocybe angulata TaxID=980116 RepID=A0A8H6HBG0_9AGAR|nr:hypothetical protein DFP72DRAFT_1178615 [Tulosesus angulatus]
MASHSPQRARRAQALQSNQGPLHNMQPRETSRSPSLRDRPRALKAQSMPMVPSVAQIYAANGAVVPTSTQQSSPTMANNTVPGRMLPIPPDQPPSHHSTGNIHDVSSEPRLSPASGPNPQYPMQPRAIRPAPAFLKSFQEADVEEHLKMTEVLADIERSDQQHVTQSQVPQGPIPYPATNYGQGPRSETPSPPKDPIERVRAMERGSPNNPEIQARRQREPARESPKVRDRQPTSPSNPAAFIQQQQQQQNQHSGAPTPERRHSPKPQPPGPANDQQGPHTPKRRLRSRLLCHT